MNAKEINKISIIDLYKSSDSAKIIDWLKDDQRKNVLALKNKIQRELDSYLNEVKRVKAMYELGVHDAKQLISALKDFLSEK